MSKAMLAALPALVIAAVSPLEAQVLLAEDAAPPSAGGYSMVLAGARRNLRPDLAMQLIAAPASHGPASKMPDFPVTIGFDQGSARLTPRATRALDQLGLAARSVALSESGLRVEGHADSLGSPEANMDLSRRRAYAVAQYLEENFALGAGRLTCLGVGDRHPLVRGGRTRRGEPSNRVVRVTLSGDG